MNDIVYDPHTLEFNENALFYTILNGTFEVQSIQFNKAAEEDATED